MSAMLPYHPALRFKQGEYLALARIAPPMQRLIEPFLIIPPPKERDPETARVPTLDEIGHLTGERIARYWPLYRAYLDTQHVAASLGDEGLVRLWRTARGTNPRLVPVVPASELGRPLYRGLLVEARPRAAIHLPFEEMDPDALRSGLRSLGCVAEDCVVFLDFTGAVLDPELATDVVSGALADLAEIAPWSRIVFQASNYPKSNPAEDGGQAVVPRHEWSVFHAAVRECQVPPERLGYSDFAADCGHITFKAGKGCRPIPHIRYTAPANTLVIRAAKEGSQDEGMRDVLRRLLSSGQFTGPGHSYADRRMWEAAEGRASTGNASTWREWNIAHHLTRVMRDLGEMAGICFEFNDVPVFEQPTLPIE
jgi:hypothetical protein